MSNPSSAVVIGGGVAGLTTAYYLGRRGVEVTLLESNRVGSGASWGNGGWICPAQAGPLPEPGLTWYGLRALLDPSSALYFQRRRLPQLSPWLLRFWSYCNRRDYARGVEALARLGRGVFELVEEMRAEGVDFELYKQGMLIAARDAEQARAELAKLEPMRAYGYDLPEDVISGEELRAVEPALSGEVGGAALVNQHWHVRPDSFTEGLAAKLRTMGVTIVEAAEVNDFSLSAGKVTSVRSAAGEYEADAFLLAAGAWTNSLATMVGVDFPMAAGKGYSFFVEPSVVPTHSILLADAHVGCTPLGKQMRIGGTMEFSGLNSRLDERRIADIAAGAKACFKPWKSAELGRRWAGMRPITPDGLPVLDSAPDLPNLYVATGYAMQGVTLAAPAGEAMAELIATGRKPALLEPFAIGRLRGLRHPGRDHG